MVGSVACFYSPKGVLFIEGEDSATFLQGQFSQELRIEDKGVAYGLWLNSKGKILADSFVLKLSSEEFLAVSYSSETDFLRENLENRIIMDEVETRTTDSDWIGVSLWGAAIEVALNLLGLEEPSENGFFSIDDVFVFWGRRNGDRNLEVVYASGELAESLKVALVDSKVHFLDTNEVSLMAMRSGNFELYRDILGSDLPQETGLGECAVSYSKGCYIGQEVMARLKSMGQARRELRCVSVSRLPEGESSWKLLDGEGKRVGELRRVLSEEGSIIGSAMLKRSRADGPFTIDGQADVVVEPITVEGGGISG